MASRVPPGAPARLPLPGVVAFEPWRLAGDWAPFCLTLLAVRNRRVGSWEAGLSEQLNRLPDGLHAPLWGVMQLGALAAPPLLGGIAALSCQPVLGRRLAGSGLAAYVLAKGVKRAVGRGRPVKFLPDVRVRGGPASGHGFVSGHAAVSMALAAEAYAHLGPRAWPLPGLGAPLVGLARVYVGAHLPLDVLGGAALGWAIARTMRRSAWISEAAGMPRGQ